MKITITDVVLRDGLQDEDVIVSTEDKVRIAQALHSAGLTQLEIASFVNPARVPQMADAAEVVAQTRDIPVRRTALALNAEGVRRAATSGVECIQIAASASNAHSRANAGRGSEAALEQLREVIAEFPLIPFIGGISTAFVCPFDGPVPLGQLVKIVNQMAGMGVERISLADTIGVATTEQVIAVLRAVRSELPDLEIGLHLHDAQGQALQTAEAALAEGIQHFDSALGGYGGCPFAPGAHGNVATERLISLCHQLGVTTGIDPEGIAAANLILEEALASGTKFKPTATN
ncbi:hydroxymethylglutaryl-CoA lyase [Streptomyces mutabilis]|uniref:hydroxymethylglutaryl-CoA lyase n=1 Tax=Streptomyces mutabilis TaxID=67332 RepID=UPI0017800C17|nr:hydroxymethylglutaryl-CoA lyase [Streptomyces mutabilis]GGQ35741.1 hydroxymethylglutaryl-CoA lyase [Streptomyces mutabilis]